MFTRMTQMAVNSTVRLRRWQMSTVRSIVRAVRMSESGMPARVHTMVTTACSAANP